MAFSKPTVFVVGAGASLPYGYPLGSDLVDAILTECHNKNSPYGSYELRQRLAEMIIAHDPLSIDAFLTRHAHGDSYLQSLGKQLIAHEILKSEDVSAFEKGKQICKDTKTNGKHVTANWYAYLYHAMMEDMDDLINPDKPPPFRIITFNYDVSLDYYLLTRIQKIAESVMSKEEKKVVLKKLEHAIVHVYGSVRNVPWSNPEFTEGEFVTHDFDTLRELDRSVFYAKDDDHLARSVQHLYGLIKGAREWKKGGYHHYIEVNKK